MKKEAEVTLNNLVYRIRNLKMILLPSYNLYQRLYLDALILKEMREITRLLYREFTEDNGLSNRSDLRQTREFTKEELAQYDGSGNKAAYVAVNGIVYDVTMEAAWGGASHFGLMAGNDLTVQFASCHEDLRILNRLPKVGVLINI